MMGDTPVALGCFLSTNECFILCEMGWQGRDPLVLERRGNTIRLKPRLKQQYNMCVM